MAAPRAQRLVHLAAAAAALCLALPAGAALPQEAPGGYLHTRWTASEGAPLQILAMAQTIDGWLWLGTHDGLYRFDGVRFYRYPLPARLGLNRNMVSEVHAGPAGELYLAYAGDGLSVIRADGRIERLPHPPASPPVHTMAVDADGSLWVMAGGIHRYKDGAWRTVDTDPAWEDTRRRGFAVDGRGRLWASNDAGTWRLDRARGRFERVLDSGGELALAPDGRLWTVSDRGEVRLAADPGTGSRPALQAHAEGRYSAQFAPDGTLWLLGCPERACLVPDAARRQDARYDIARAANLRFGAAAPMAGDDPRSILVDREGNVWVSTEQGLNRYARNAFVPSGLPGTGEDYSLATDGNGQAWAANIVTGKLWRLRTDGPPEPQPGPYAGIVEPGRDGTLLVGGKRTIQRRGAGAIEEIPLPPGRDGKPADLTMLGIRDDGKVLWTATLETGLIGWQGSRWQPRAAFRLPAKIYQSASGASGQLWLTTGDGGLYAYDAEHGAGKPLDVSVLGMVGAIFPGPELVLSGDGGSGVVRDRRLHLLGAEEPEVLRNVSGLVATADGDRWLNGSAGLVHVRAEDWRRSVADARVPLRYELFGPLDGYPGKAAAERRWPSAWSGDGRHLWLAASGGVVRFDTAAVPRNPVRPTAAILGLDTDDAHHAPQHGLRLPPGSARFRIDYTAPALRKPERVRFEYRLDGVDASWQDGGTRRATTYTNVGPGSYVFRVRAINEDGVPSAADAELAFDVAPTLVQTTWFRVLCGAALALLGMGAYRWRVRYLTGRVAERMRVQTAERERIARTLHDTFLQTVQGLILRLDAVAASLPPGERARNQLEAVLDDAGKAIGEGRDQLQELRAGDALVLEDVLQDATARLAAAGAPAIELQVEGERRALRAAVAAEVADLAREALRNACRHAGATLVRITLAYGRRALVVTIADDGKGFPPDVLRDGGRGGHWGMVGMRERAARIGARLEFANGTRGGAVVLLDVPSGRAYAAR
ncbi:sensor histidine kinase [Massilia sp. TN1-12]|uniref:sensor histidine kinase n=1 Tax=Massilia paldalensis TaxID=3377675 RepID=UPI00384D37D4